MIDLFVVYDESFPGHRVFCSTTDEALSYHKGIVSEHGSAPKIDHHVFPNTPSLIAFLMEDLREYRSVDLEKFNTE